MNGGYESDTEAKARRQATNDTFRKLEGDVSGYIGRCLFMTDDSGEFCSEPVANNSHMVPESAILKELRDGENENILELQWGLSQWRELAFSDDPERAVGETYTFEPAEKPTGLVCKGRFACKRLRHDDEYGPIDGAQPNFDIPEVRLQTFLRLEQFRADQLNQASQLHVKWTPPSLRKTQGQQRKFWVQEGAKYKEAYRSALPIVKSLGQNWYARRTGGQFDPDMVSRRVLTFRSKIRVAGGVFYEGPTDVYVFPLHDDLHKMAILYLSSNSEMAQRHVERLEQVAEESEQDEGYGVSVTKELMTQGWGTLALSPKSYSELDDHDRTTIRKLVAQHSRASELLPSAHPQSPGWQLRWGQRR